jgi:LL-diaminopimelate aminotransferase
VVETLNKMGLQAQLPKASLYIWAKVPDGYTSAEFAADLLDKVGVVVTPGLGYGRSGEGYVRLSLTVQDAVLVKGLSRMAAWRDSKNILRYKK